MPVKTAAIGFTLCIALTGVMSYQYNKINNENLKLSIINSIYEAEHRILKDEISEWERKPDYEQGYRDALIRIGGPQQAGAYQDGWDAAMIVASDGGYATGYHTAIQQFGYQKPETGRWLVAESNIKFDSPEKTKAEIEKLKEEYKLKK